MTIDTRNQSITEKVTELSEVGLKLVPAAGAATTLTAAEPAGETVLAVASETGFSANDYVAVGIGNTMDIGQIASTGVGTITLKSGLKFAQASGAAVTELEDIVLGEVSEDGVADELSLGVTTHLAGTRHGPWDASPGHHEQEMNWQILNATLDNLKYALGLVDADGGGTGSLADPWFVDADPERFAKALQQSAQCLSGRIPAVYVKGEYLNTGEIFETQWWSCALAGGERGFTLAIGDAVMVPFRFIWFANRRSLRYASS